MPTNETAEIALIEESKQTTLDEKGRLFHSTDVTVSAAAGCEDPELMPTDEELLTL